MADQDKGDSVNPRAQDGAAGLQAVRSAVIPSPLARCGTCAVRGFDRPVVKTKTGAQTALCAFHTELEVTLRRELRAAAISGQLSAEEAKRVRDRVWSRAKAQAAEGRP